MADIVDSAPSEHRRQGELTPLEILDPIDQGVPAVDENDLALAERTDVSVLVIADTGTTRRNLARRIHDQSARHHGPWVAIADGVSGGRHEH